ncbi:protein yippee-like 2 [Arapaima gigas]
MKFGSERLAGARGGSRLGSPPRTVASSAPPEVGSHTKRSHSRSRRHLRLFFSVLRCARPTPRPTTALTCVLRCFPCEPSWAGSPFLHRPPTPAPPPPPTAVTMTRSKTFQAYLPSCHRTYSCIHCRAHLANHDELISKSFQGSQGRAYLFNSVVNVGCGPAEERVLLTGLHAVADIYCENCKTTLGWKYEHAFESSQKYKEGKFIIELAHMIKDNGWD